jgi:hypothetical protein
MTKPGEAMIEREREGAKGNAKKAFAPARFELQ